MSQDNIYLLNGTYEHGFINKVINKQTMVCIGVFNNGFFKKEVEEKIYFNIELISVFKKIPKIITKFLNLN